MSVNINYKLNELINKRKQLLQLRLNRVKQVQQLRDTLFSTLSEMKKELTTINDNKLKQAKRLEMRMYLIDKLIELAKLVDKFHSIRYEQLENLIGFQELKDIQDKHYNMELLHTESLNFALKMNELLNESIDIVSKHEMNDKYKKLIELLFEINKLKQIEFYCPLWDLINEPINKIFSLLSHDSSINTNLMNYTDGV